MLLDCRITNAVRCVPPQNKPLPAEIATCRAFLRMTLDDMTGVVAILALGRVAHESVVRLLDGRLAATPFGHGREHDMPVPDGRIRVFDSYHCSRYNTNTGVLTTEMFRAVFTRLRAYLDET